MGPPDNPLLDAAWQAALADAEGSHDRWRVLADLLLESGDAQGELMNLELDAEAGRLRGLARLRHAQLREELLPTLLPAGVVGGLVRGAVQTCTVQALGVPFVDDARWRTVRALHFAPQRTPPTAQAWAHSPLRHAHLVNVETLDGLEEEALAVLASAPVRPRLRRVGVVGSVGRPDPGPPPGWDARWETLLRAHPRLREVHLGWCGLSAVGRARLSCLRRLELDRVVTEVSVDELHDLHGWLEEHRPRFALVAQLRNTSLAAVVEVSASQLVLRAPADRLARVERVVRDEWRGPRPLPPLRAEPA